jgi:Phosphate-selective porin O and P
MKDLLKRNTLFAVPVVAALLLLAHPASAQIQVTSPDGTMSGKFGILGQLTGETLDSSLSSTSTLNQHTAQDLYLRRIRFIAGFKLWDKLNVFFDTDSPNVGKSDGLGGKTATDIFVQDLLVTYTFAKEFQLEGGFFLPPNSYNHTQSAAQLLAIDYGANTFLESVPLGERTGRDYGVEARGYLGGDHLEYRAGVFQGLRTRVDNNSFLYGARLSYWVFGAQTGYVYRGTSLGKTQSLEIGGSYSKQDDYKSSDIDLFWDQPVAGDGVTLQVDFNNLDGGAFLITLPKQKNTLVEVGYYAHAVKLMPYGQYTQRSFDVKTAANQDETRYEIGLGWYPHGYNSNLKLGIGKIDRDTSKKRNQVRLQYQVYAF